jgi:hypothetical protein
MVATVDAYNSNRALTEHADEVVTESMLEFSELQSWRATFAGQWEEVAETVLPTSRNTFFYGNFNWPGQKKTDRQIDATAMMALSRFAAILDSLLTPRNQIWMQLTTQDPTLQKDRDTRLWYEEATRVLFQQRYSPIGNFSAMNQQIYQSLGAFGTGGMFIDQAVNAWNVPIKQLRYKAIPLGELFIHENHQGVVDGCVRWFRLTARQAIQKWGDKCGGNIKAAAEKHSQMPFDFLHRICQRSDYEHGRLDMKGKPYASYYISIQDRCLLEEGGYTSFPIAVTRYDQTPGEVYGRGPAMMVLPAIKTLNAMKTTMLKQAHRAADPVYLIADDGLIDPQFHPGAQNKGGWSMDGRPLVGTLPVGSYEIGKEAHAEEKSLILDAFLVQLFQILTETPSMTATEVIERTNEKGILLAPTVGRQQSEYLGPMTDREMDLLSFMGVLPPMPPMLKSAKGLYHVNYTSPLARAQRAQEVAGFQRTIQSTLEVVKVTQDPSPFDVFDFDKATRDTAEIQAVPESWMASDKDIAAKRKARAQAQAQQMQVQAMPAQAAMMKAQTDRDAKNLTTQQYAPQGGGQPPQGGQPQGPQQ